jgi:hypothetical protein
MRKLDAPLVMFNVETAAFNEVVYVMRFVEASFSKKYPNILGFYLVPLTYMPTTKMKIPHPSRWLVFRMPSRSRLV